MLLTTKQVSLKLKCRQNYVVNLIRHGKLVSATTPKPGAQKTKWEVDEKVLREFMKTWHGVPSRGGHQNGQPKAPKPNGNGHAGDLQMLPLPIPSLVALEARLKAAEAKLDTVIAKLDALRTLWA